MAAINIKEEKVVTITMENGRRIEKGALLLLRATTEEDILCYFKEIKDGYFCTEAFTDRAPVKYRLRSIVKCEEISQIIKRGE